MQLFYKPTCPYCIKVLLFAEDNRHDFELKNIVEDPANAKELIERGGKRQIPYLVCDCGAEMYESDDIISHIQQCKEKTT